MYGGSSSTIVSIIQSFSDFFQLVSQNNLDPFPPRVTIYKYTIIQMKFMELFIIGKHCQKINIFGHRPLPNDRRVTNCQTWFAILLSYSVRYLLYSHIVSYVRIYLLSSLRSSTWRYHSYSPASLMFIDDKQTFTCLLSLVMFAIVLLILTPTYPSVHGPSWTGMIYLLIVR